MKGVTPEQFPGLIKIQILDQSKFKALKYSKKEPCYLFMFYKLLRECEVLWNFTFILLWSYALKDTVIYHVMEKIIKTPIERVIYNN